MKLKKTLEEMLPGSAPPVDDERRRSRRRAAYGAYVAIEAPAVSEDLCWSGTLMDVNGDGMALTLPSELGLGVEVLLTLRLGDDTQLDRVPSVVVRQEDGIGAVQFKEWSEDDRLRLLTYLLED